MSRKKAEIIFKEYDTENFIVFIKRDSKNLFMDMGLCNFESEMEYWDMPTKLIEFNGQKGYLFSSKLDILEIKDEIEGFMMHNDI